MHGEVHQEGFVVQFAELNVGAPVSFKVLPCHEISQRDSQPTPEVFTQNVVAVRRFYRFVVVLGSNGYKAPPIICADRELRGTVRGKIQSERLRSGREGMPGWGCALASAPNSAQTWLLHRPCWSTATR